MPERPNLLYLHSDQHAPSVLGCYGDPLGVTPNLDALAQRGVVMDAAYCPCPICVPSRMSTLTCQYPTELEVWNNNHILSSGVPTLAHAMGAGGYHPVLIGRMHALGPDQLHGYAERLVGDHGPNHLGGGGVKREILAGTAGPERVSLERSGPGQSGYQVHDEDVTAAAVDYLNRLGVRQRAGLLDQPFSISVGFMLPHQPFVARACDFERFWGRVGLPKNPAPPMDEVHPYFRWWREQCGIVEVSEEEILRARTAYWALCYRLDAMIGEILAALERNGLADNTLVVYTSDHGEQAGEHGLWWKQTFYEESVRVPMVLSWPGVLPEGEHCRRVAGAHDLVATMLDALDCPALPNGHGRSLLPVVTGQSNDWEDVAVSEYCTDEGCYHRMVRAGDWKLCYYHGQPTQLFNLAEDPDELHDRAADPACRELVERLTARVLDGWDPDQIAARMAGLAAETKVLTAWTRGTKPADQYRWPWASELEYLDPWPLPES